MVHISPVQGAQRKDCLEMHLGEEAEAKAEAAGDAEPGDGDDKGSKP